MSAGKFTPDEMKRITAQMPFYDAYVREVSASGKAMSYHEWNLHRRERLSATELMVDDVNSAGRKLRVAMEEGPDGLGCWLTPSEATVVFRLLTEQFGMKL